MFYSQKIGGTKITSVHRRAHLAILIGKSVPSNILTTFNLRIGSHSGLLRFGAGLLGKTDVQVRPVVTVGLNNIGSN